MMQMKYNFKSKIQNFKVQNPNTPNFRALFAIYPKRKKNEFPSSQTDPGLILFVTLAPERKPNDFLGPSVALRGSYT